VLETSEIDPVRRAETLTVEEFVKLSNTLIERKQNRERS
jgi:16S rRNA A1518/A1519 N6-dimethyltransferase RsmA/KsgA/DIM1 with predicted DNA glycosylase/AP lyase activity